MSGDVLLMVLSLVCWWMILFISLWNVVDIVLIFVEVLFSLSGGVLCKFVVESCVMVECNWLSGCNSYSIVVYIDVLIIVVSIRSD